jgi:cytoskeletal protein RodZ
MKLQKTFFRAGLLATLVAGPTVAWAAGESALSDNFIILGLAAALVIFAFTRKSEKQAPPPAPVEEPSAEPEPAEETAAAEEPAAEEAGAAEASAEPEATPPESAG